MVIQQPCCKCTNKGQYDNQRQKICQDIKKLFSKKKKNRFCRCDTLQDIMRQQELAANSEIIETIKKQEEIQQKQEIATTACETLREKSKKIGLLLACIIKKCITESILPIIKPPTSSVQERYNDVGRYLASMVIDTIQKQNKDNSNSGPDKKNNSATAKPFEDFPFTTQQPNQRKKRLKRKKEHKCTNCKVYRRQNLWNKSTKVQCEEERQTVLDTCRQLRKFMTIDEMLQWADHIRQRSKTCSKGPESNVKSGRITARYLKCSCSSTSKASEKSSNKSELFNISSNDSQCQCGLNLPSKRNQSTKRDHENQKLQFSRSTELKHNCDSSCSFNTQSSSLQAKRNNTKSRINLCGSNCSCNLQDDNQQKQQKGKKEMSNIDGPSSSDTEKKKSKKQHTPQYDFDNNRIYCSCENKTDKQESKTSYKRSDGTGSPQLSSGDSSSLVLKCCAGKKGNGESKHSEDIPKNIENGNNSISSQKAGAEPLEAQQSNGQSDKKKGNTKKNDEKEQCINNIYDTPKKDMTNKTIESNKQKKETPKNTNKTKKLIKNKRSVKKTGKTRSSASSVTVHSTNSEHILVNTEDTKEKDSRTCNFHSKSNFESEDNCYKNQHIYNDDCNNYFSAKIPSFSECTSIFKFLDEYSLAQDNKVEKSTADKVKPRKSKEDDYVLECKKAIKYSQNNLSNCNMSTIKTNNGCKRNSNNDQRLPNISGTICPYQSIRSLNRSLNNNQTKEKPRRIIDVPAPTITTNRTQSPCSKKCSDEYDDIEKDFMEKLNDINIKNLNVHITVNSKEKNCPKNCLEHNDLENISAENIEEENMENNDNNNGLDLKNIIVRLNDCDSFCSVNWDDIFCNCPENNSEILPECSKEPTEPQCFPYKKEIPNQENCFREEKVCCSHQKEQQFNAELNNDCNCLRGVINNKNRDKYNCSCFNDVNEEFCSCKKSGTRESNNSNQTKYINKENLSKQLTSIPDVYQMCDKCNKNVNLPKEETEPFCENGVNVTEDFTYCECSNKISPKQEITKPSCWKKNNVPWKYQQRKRCSFNDSNLEEEIPCNVCSDRIAPKQQTLTLTICQGENNKSLTFQQKKHCLPKDLNEEEEPMCFKCTNDKSAPREENFKSLRQENNLPSNYQQIKQCREENNKPSTWQQMKRCSTSDSNVEDKFTGCVCSDDITPKEQTLTYRRQGNESLCDQQMKHHSPTCLNAKKEMTCSVCSENILPNEQSSKSTYREDNRESFNYQQTNNCSSYDTNLNKKLTCWECSDKIEPKNETLRCRREDNESLCDQQTKLHSVKCSIIREELTCWVCNNKILPNGEKLKSLCSSENKESLNEEDELTCWICSEKILPKEETLKSMCWDCINEIAPEEVHHVCSQQQIEHRFSNCSNKEEELTCCICKHEQTHRRLSSCSNIEEELTSCTCSNEIISEEEEQEQEEVEEELDEKEEEIEQEEEEIEEKEEEETEEGEEEKEITPIISEEKNESFHEEEVKPPIIIKIEKEEKPPKIKKEKRPPKIKKEEEPKKEKIKKVPIKKPKKIKPIKKEKKRKSDVIETEEDPPMKNRCSKVDKILSMENTNLLPPNNTQLRLEKLANDRICSENKPRCSCPCQNPCTNPNLNICIPQFRKHC